MTKTLLTSLALSLPLLSGAADLSNDLRFYQYRVDLDGQANAGELVRVLVPQHLYELSQQGFTDLAVFNADGQSLAFSLRNQDSGGTSREIRQPGQIYYVPKPVRESAADWRLDFTLDNNQQLSWRHQGQASIDNVIILDLGPNLQSDWQLEGLLLTPKEANSNYQAEITIEQSHDLNRWQSLGQHAFTYLGEMSDAGAHGIAVQAPAARFIRLNWPNQTAIELTNAKAILRAQNLRRSDLLTLNIEANGSSGNGLTWFYQGFPDADVQGLNFALPNNEVINGRLVGISPQRHRQILGQVELYNQPSRNRRNPGLSFNNRKFDRFELISQRPLTQGPTLELQVVPQQLVFAAEGPGPFVVAVGHARTGVSNDYQPGLVLGLSPDTLAALTTLEAKAGQANPAFQPPRASNLQTLGLIGLWLGLILGLALLVWMLIRLAKDMKKR